MVDEVSKEIKLNLSGIPDDQHDDLKEEIGQFVVNEILRNVAQGKSPVKGESFKKLSLKYAQEQKQGRRTPNLNLEGDMLAALKFDPTPAGIKVGIFGDEADKADGHNKHHGNNKSLPRRRFIPKGYQNFKPEITNEIKSILKEAKEDARELEEINRQRDEAFEPDPEQAIQTARTQAITIDTVLREENIIRSLLRQFDIGSDNDG